MQDVHDSRGCAGFTTTEFSDGFASDQKTLVHDPAGNLTFDGVYYYEYDYKNRLGRVTRCGSADGAADFEASGRVKSGSASKLGSVIATYTYDGLNRRLRKVVAGSGSLDQDTRFYYSGWRCVEERTITDAAPATWAERPWKRYTWGGRYLDELVRYEADTTADGSVDKDYYVHQDALYNVVAVVAHGGDDDGAVVERAEYDPYGRARLFDKNNTPLSASALGLDYLFTGQRRDSETGLYYFKNRYYDADTGRFTARDPIGYADGCSLFAAHFIPHGTDPEGLLVGEVKPAAKERPDTSAYPTEHVYNGREVALRGTVMDAATPVMMQLALTDMIGRSHQNKMAAECRKLCKDPKGDVITEPKDSRLFHLAATWLVNVGPDNEPRTNFGLTTSVAFTLADGSKKTLKAPSVYILAAHMGYAGFYSWECKCETESFTAYGPAFSAPRKWQTATYTNHVPAVQKEYDDAVKQIQAWIDKTQHELGAVSYERTAYGEDGGVSQTSMPATVGDMWVDERKAAAP